VELSDAREKITSDITGIDPGTFRIVAQWLNHYVTPGPILAQCLNHYTTPGPILAQWLNHYVTPGPILAQCLNHYVTPGPIHIKNDLNKSIRNDDVNKINNFYYVNFKNNTRSCLEIRMHSVQNLLSSSFLSENLKIRNVGWRCLRIGCWVE
jgi:hypothetical protein